MGKAISHKVSSKGENNLISYAASAMQGCYHQMEDFRTTVLDLGVRPGTSFFAVYDGHGGADVARYCSIKFHETLATDAGFLGNDLDTALKNAFSSIDETLEKSDDWRRTIAYPPGIKKLIRRLRIGAYTVKRRLCKAPYIGPVQEGSTTCMAIIRDENITVGNIGDSRCVLSYGGQALELSTNHKPDMQVEKDRILKAGGQVEMDERGCNAGIYCVEGKLPTSRSFGDFEFKQNKDLTREHQMVTCHPDIFEMKITVKTEFLLIASFGVWAVMKNKQAIDFVRERLQSEKDSQAICEELLDLCLSKGSKLNMSVILVRFNTQPAATVEGSTNPSGHEGNQIKHLAKASDLQKTIQIKNETGLTHLDFPDEAESSTTQIAKSKMVLVSPKAREMLKGFSGFWGQLKFTRNAALTAEKDGSGQV